MDHSLTSWIHFIFFIVAVSILVPEAVPSTRESIQSPRFHRQHSNTIGKQSNITRFNALISDTDLYIDEPRLISEESKQESSFVLQSRSSSLSRSRSYSPPKLQHQNSGNPKAKRAWRQAQTYAFSGGALVAQSKARSSIPVRSGKVKQPQGPDKNKDKLEIFESKERTKTPCAAAIVGCLKHKIPVVASLVIFILVIVVASVGL